MFENLKMKDFCVLKMKYRYYWLMPSKHKFLRSFNKGIS
jgi:hypothetical protein